MFDGHNHLPDSSRKHLRSLSIFIIGFWTAAPAAHGWFFRLATSFSSLVKGCSIIQIQNLGMPIIPFWTAIAGPYQVEAGPPWLFQCHILCGQPVNLIWFLHISEADNGCHGKLLRRYIQRWNVTSMYLHSFIHYIIPQRYRLLSAWRIR